MYVLDTKDMNANDLRDSLSHEMMKLRQIAEAAFVMGNDVLADRLFHICEAASAYGDGLYKAWSDEISRSVRQARESSRIMLEATMAGMELGKREQQSEK